MREVSKRLLAEAEIFKSLDHVVRAFDSALFSLQDLGLLDEEAVECLLDYLGERFAPYVVLMHRYRGEIWGQRARFRLATAYLGVISRYARMYRRRGFEAPRLPLGFDRPPPGRAPPATVETGGAPVEVEVPVELPPPVERSPKTYSVTDRVTVVRTGEYATTGKSGRRLGAPRLPVGGQALRWLAVALVFVSLFAPWFWLDFGGYYRLTAGPLYADVTVGMPGSFTLTTRAEGFSFSRIMVLLLAGLVLGGYAAYSGSHVSAAFSGISLAMAVGIFATDFSSSIPELLGFTGTLLGAGAAPQTHSLWGKATLQTYYGPLEVAWGLTIGFYLALAATILMLISIFSRS